MKEKDSASSTSSTRSKYPRINSKRDRKDRYHLSHRHRDNKKKEDPRTTLEKEQPTCYKCKKLGHYANNCPDRKKYDKKAKIQSTQRNRSQSVASNQSSSQSSSRSSSRLSLDTPKTPMDNSDSSDSLN